MCGIYYGGADMTKRYNSVIGILASIDHDTPDGYDLTADDIRERLQERLNSVPDDELLEASGLTDTVDNKPEPDTRPFNVYKVTATEYVGWEVDCRCTRRGRGLPASERGRNGWRVVREERVIRLDNPRTSRATRVVQRQATNQ